MLCRDGGVCTSMGKVLAQHSGSPGSATWTHKTELGAPHLSLALGWRNREDRSLPLLYQQICPVQSLQVDWPAFLRWEFFFAQKLVLCAACNALALNGFLIPQTQSCSSQHPSVHSVHIDSLRQAVAMAFLKNRSLTSLMLTLGSFQSKLLTMFKFVFI